MQAASPDFHFTDSCTIQGLCEGMSHRPVHMVYTYAWSRSCWEWWAMEQACRGFVQVIHIIVHRIQPLKLCHHCLQAAGAAAAGAGCATGAGQWAPPQPQQALDACWG